MKNTKIILKFIVIIFLGFIAIEVFAAEDVFAKVKGKGDEIIKGLKAIVAVVTTIVIIVAGIMSYKGRLATQNMIAIIVGAIIIGAAAEIALFLTT